MTDATSLGCAGCSFSREMCHGGKRRERHRRSISFCRCMRPLESRISICDLKVGETKICAETSISPQLLCASPRVSEPLGRVGLRRPPRACLRPSQGANSLPARSDRACLPSFRFYLFWLWLCLDCQSVPDPSDPVAEACLLPAGSADVSVSLLTVHEHRSPDRSLLTVHEHIDVMRGMTPPRHQGDSHGARQQTAGSGHFYTPKTRDSPRTAIAGFCRWVLS